MLFKLIIYFTFKTIRHATLIRKNRPWQIPNNKKQLINYLGN